ncbi:hypothetical protein TNCV_180711 [Trichonephila clavipes]|nr:hypothetical protein TNCV_180711 [Trichonephila clavipes]
MTSTREPNAVETWSVGPCLNSQSRDIVERADHPQLFSLSVGEWGKFHFFAIGIVVIAFFTYSGKERVKSHRAILMKWYWARTCDKASHSPIPIPLGYRGHRASPEIDESRV